MVPYAEFSNEYLLQEDGHTKFNRMAKSKQFADGQCAWGYFTTGYLTTKFSLPFEAGLLLCFPLPPSLPSFFLSFLPSFFPYFPPFFFLSFFLFFFSLWSYPREVYKRNISYDFFLGGIGNKFRELKPKP